MIFIEQVPILLVGVTNAAKMTPDEKCLKAVEGADTAAVRKMVAGAAYDAGYRRIGYHGSGGEYHTFKTSESGWYGSGICFTNSPDLAEEYAAEQDGTPHVAACYLKMSNPYRYTEDADNPGEANFNLIRAVFPAREANLMIESMQEESTGYIGPELTERLKARGHDSIVVTDPATGSKEFVVFSPKQVKSAEDVVRDDIGNIIPLSKRFILTDDIRGDTDGLPGRHHHSGHGGGKEQRSL